MNETDFYKPDVGFSVLPEEAREPAAAEKGHFFAWTPARFLRDTAAAAALCLTFSQAPVASSEMKVDPRVVEGVLATDAATAATGADRDAAMLLERVGSTPEARARAGELLRAMKAQGIEPARIVPTSNNGVGLYLFSPNTIDGGAHARYVLFECDDDGTAAVLEDRERNTSQVVEVDASGAEDAIAMADAFVRSARDVARAVIA